MRKVLAYAVAVLVVAGTAGAQTPPIEAVMFDEAVSRAIAENPTLSRATKAIEQAEALFDQARSFTLPFVGANLGGTLLNTGVSFEDTTVVPRGQFTLGATVNMPVLALSEWARVSQARDRVGVATASANEVRVQIAVAAAEAYLAVRAAARQVEVDRRAIETAQAHLDYARRRLEGGIGSRLNMLRAAEELSVAQARLEGTELLKRQAQEALGVLLAADGPVDASEDPKLDTPGAIDETAWMAARPDLVTQGAIIRAAERVVRDSWKDVSPYATVGFEPQYITPASFFQPSGSWRIVLNVTQPVYQGGRQRALMRERQVTLDATRIELTELEIRARSEVREAQASVGYLTRALEYSQQAAREAGEVLDITATVFEVGATTNIELIDAQRSARDRETLATIAENALQRARLRLLVALGRFPH
ncbi:MAG TPA: TolC family protein [Vicinamibacterales bacterium]|nr:TolC family protein [Vicinamibacterales bacterium]